MQTSVRTGRTGIQLQETKAWKVAGVRVSARPGRRGAPRPVRAALPALRVIPTWHAHEKMSLSRGRNRDRTSTSASTVPAPAHRAGAVPESVGQSCLVSASVGRFARALTLFLSPCGVRVSVFVRVHIRLAVARSLACLLRVGRGCVSMTRCGVPAHTRRRADSRP